MTTRLRLTLGIAIVLAGLIGAHLLAVDGPITNALNLRVRTDGNNYLMAASGTYSGVDGPITNFANLRLRTDANNYLIVTYSGTQAFGAITATSLITTGSISTGASGDLTSGHDIVVAAARFLYWTGRTLTSSTADKLLQVLSNAGTTGMEISAGTPTLGTCTAGAITSGSHNFGGEVTGNTSGTCAVLFGTPAFTNAPYCQATDGTGARALFITTVTAAGFTVNGLTSGDAFTFACVGRIGT